MKNRDNKPDDSCGQIMHLFVQKDSDEFTNKEQVRIQKHIETCPSCRAFQEGIEELFTSFAVDLRSQLEPNPKIRKKTLARLRQKESSDRPFIVIRRFILDFTKLKIPVYQAVVGTMILLLAFFFLSGQKTTISQLPSDRNQPQLYSQIIEEFFNIHGIGINPYPKIGRSLKEDSLLYKMSTVTEWEQTFQRTDTLRIVQL